MNGRPTVGGLIALPLLVLTFAVASAMPASADPDCSTPGGVATVSGVAATPVDGGVRITIAAAQKSRCVDQATISIGFATSAHSGYSTVDFITLVDATPVSYDRTFAASPGWLGIAVGANGTVQGVVSDLQTLQNLSTTIPTPVAPIEDDDWGASADEAPVAPVAPTPTASAASTPTSTAASTPTAAPVSSDSLASAPTSDTSSPLVGIVAIVVMLLAIATLVVLLILRHRSTSQVTSQHEV